MVIGHWSLHLTLYTMSYGFLHHRGRFPNDTPYEYVYKYNHPNLLLVHTPIVWYALHSSNHLMQYYPRRLRFE